MLRICHIGVTVTVTYDRNTMSLKVQIYLTWHLMILKTKQNMDVSCCPKSAVQGH